jgi:NADH:ubiquinone oxidoreductase subunit C
MMSLQTLVGEIETRFAGVVIEKVVDEKKLVKVVVSPENIKSVALYLRDSLGFDHVKAVTGVDLSRLLKKRAV